MQYSQTKRPHLILLTPDHGNLHVMCGDTNIFDLFTSEDIQTDEMDLHIKQKFSHKIYVYAYTIITTNSTMYN
jgi:hypothetical protein